MKYSTTSIVLYLDGGPRNFQYLQSMNVLCVRVLEDKGYGIFLPNEFDSNGFDLCLLSVFIIHDKSNTLITERMLHFLNWWDERERITRASRYVCFTKMAGWMRIK